jgi:hypothetical protein
MPIPHSNPIAEAMERIRLRNEQRRLKHAKDANARDAELYRLGHARELIAEHMADRAERQQR